MHTENLIDKTVLFLCCLVFYLCQNAFESRVAVVLTAVSFGTFLSYFDKEIVKVLITVFYSVLCLLYPPLVLYLPVIAYDMIFNKYQAVNLVAIAPFVLFAQNAPLPVTATVASMLFFSLLLRCRTQKKIDYKRQCSILSDKTLEMSRLLEEQKRDLIARQDDELAIATLNERNRIAREIHDNVGHLLSGSILQTAALQTVANDKGIKEGLETLNRTLTQAMDNIRQSVHDIYDQSIDLNLEIEKIIDRFQFCEVRYDYSFNSNQDKKLKYAFIAIVKEALANVAKHSDATYVSITFREHPAFYQLVIKDNGHVKEYRTDEGLGLKNMADRVESFHGHMNISVDQGFQIFITIPKEKQE
jgi:signal transduction histidine kinase